MSPILSQNANTIVLVRPTQFSLNPQATDNQFIAFDSPQTDIAAKARAEFDRFVAELRAHDIDVLIWNDEDAPHTPDSIFPNNVTTTFADGTVVFSAMKPENRHAELAKHRRWLQELKQQGFQVQKIRDYSVWREKGEFLEGTGSLVLDRVHRVAYASIAERTTFGLLAQWGKDQDYRLMPFSAFFRNVPVYHTNLVMNLGERYALICWEVIANQDRQQLRDSFAATKKEVIELTPPQFSACAGNALEVRNSSGEKYLVMSDGAFRSLTPEQVQRLEELSGKILHPALDVIEEIGGGSARCMMLELFLPRQKSGA